MAQARAPADPPSGTGTPSADPELPAAPPGLGTAKPTPPDGLTGRTVCLALALQIGIICWVVRSEVTARVFVSSWSLPMPGVLALLLLLLFNRARRRPWRPAELLFVYLTVSTTVMLVGYDFLQLLIPA